MQECLALNSGIEQFNPVAGQCRDICQPLEDQVALTRMPQLSSALKQFGRLPEVRPGPVGLCDHESARGQALVLPTRVGLSKQAGCRHPAHRPVIYRVQFATTIPVRKGARR